MSQFDILVYTIVHGIYWNSPSIYFYQGLHFDLKKTAIVFEDLSRNSVFFRTEVKPYFHPNSYPHSPPPQKKNQLPLYRLPYPLVNSTCSAAQFASCSGNNTCIETQSCTRVSLHDDLECTFTFKAGPCDDSWGGGSKTKEISMKNIGVKV